MNKRFQFSLASLLIVVTVAAGVIAAGTYYYHEIVMARAAAVRASTAVKLKQVLEALHFNCESSRPLPIATNTDAQGNPLSSWRFRILWAIEQQDMEHPENGPFYGESWMSPGNIQMRSKLYSCFSFVETERNTPTFGHTNVFAITGPGTAFDPLLNIQGSFARLVTEPATKDTILLVEVRNSKTHWMQPGDFDIRTMPHTINDPAGEGISGTSPGCFCVGFADTEAWMLRNDTPFDKLALFFTIEGARKHDRDVELGPYRMK